MALRKAQAHDGDGVFGRSGHAAQPPRTVNQEMEEVIGVETSEHVPLEGPVALEMRMDHGHGFTSQVCFQTMQ